ncbi:unnamed protein product, partial [Nesidiocoris tenuis]
MIQPSNDVLFEENLSKVNIHRPSRRRRTSAVALGQKSRLRARTRRRMIFILSLRRIWVYGTGDRTPRRQTVRVRRQTREIRFARTLRDNMEICYTSRRENTKNEKHLIVEKTGPTSLFSMEVTLHDGCVRVAGCVAEWIASVCVYVSCIFDVCVSNPHCQFGGSSGTDVVTSARLGRPWWIFTKDEEMVSEKETQVLSLLSHNWFSESACGSRFETNLSVSSTIVGRGIWTVGKIDFHDPMAIIRGSILRT